MWNTSTAAALLSGLFLLPATSQAGVEFNRDIRPILSDKCFACHGPDASTREADLRLDLRDDAIRDLGGYRAVVPGNPENSLIIERITSTEDYERMPPPDHGKPLTAEEVATLKTWIEQGAEYEEHWSLAPLKRPAVPEAGADHPVDAFIQAKLAERGLKPNPTADARTLSRRLSFDLTGLPPESSMVDQLQTANDSAHYEQLVDELLASPHYGERMAQYWLDLVRYADTLGFHGDQPRSVSPYRDYVIAAFNDNKPFDEFTIEQLAGDLLPEATMWQKVASTYNRLNRASGEGGVQPKEYLAKYSADRVRTTGVVWLGMTFGCAECHDHKFDPISAKDFYSFAAFFADIKEQGIVRGAKHIEQMPVPTPEQQDRQTALNEAIQKAEAAYLRTDDKLQQAQRVWEQELLENQNRWTVLQPASVTSNGDVKFAIEDDGAVLASGPNPSTATYEVVTSAEQPVEAGQPFALRLELLPHDSLPRKGPGRAGNGNLVIHSIEMTVGGQSVTWRSGKATHTQKGHSPENVVSGKGTGFAILPKAGEPIQLLLIGDFPAAAAGDAVIRIQQNHGSGHTLGHFRLSASTDPTATELAPAVEKELLEILAVAEAERSTEQKKQLDTAFRKTTPFLADERETLNRLKAERDQLKNAIVTTLVSVSTTPREMRVLPRGNWMDDSGEVVKPTTPHFLPGPAGTEAERLNRLDLARWMTSKENPLVARTFVNRLWMLMFGHGLARNVDDLGSQGEPPTHPELLDWLAVEFIESGWDVKHLVRLLVTSDTYRQSSTVTPQLKQQDPLNRWYARQSRWRLDAEMVRDNALMVSGLLNLDVGGVSAKPYQPAGYWAQLNFPKRTYQHDQGTQQYRRGVYTHWQRTFLHPSLLAFDAPAREECTAQRTRSNTPLQSLVLLNDPTYVEAARLLATRVLQQDLNDDVSRLQTMYELTLQRSPREDESQVLMSQLQEDRRIYNADAAAAKQLISVGLTPTATDVAVEDLAAWTNVARSLLNLHETITRY
ncbi:PSD1 and planctomycete cytochrome C domain-containing protein [Rubinisphaera brasiliensis]|uniref:Cytochrome c domain-containing protein n=1 Tax=Rubinisphaera brasiliensis (strain ATCC 49424 / DSM 5305 / JCM 21570 / IAM 15109 / NBRC 103401 / IFAM 1448) TaxID=756272 RepID=F0SJQ0_RUBBR|nr:PSD1 and planctomycete cytochrome C domain-containing protein [Rubinisphaera brasiliensis]ADY61888.1 protein of unknown function DUF1549 [Rubinisphaera brasiliensis DSM 5305]